MEPKGEIVIVVAGLPQETHKEHRNKYRMEGKDDGQEEIDG